MYVGLVIGRYKTFQFILIHEGDKFVRGLISREHRHVKGFVREDVELATFGHYLWQT